MCRIICMTFYSYPVVSGIQKMIYYIITLYTNYVLVDEDEGMQIDKLFITIFKCYYLKTNMFNVIERALSMVTFYYILSNLALIQEK